MKYWVIHFSINWIDNPAIDYFASFEEAKDYVENLRLKYDDDSCYILEQQAQFKRTNIDETSEGPIFGFRTNGKA